ncbi:MAG: sensor histidine kinase [Proteobacteria bacterium]|nr:sensor histidine kinase [Pseudomonadota bacterium]
MTNTRPASAPAGRRAFPARTHLAVFGLCLALPLLAALSGFVFSSIRQERLSTERRVVQELNQLVDSLERDLERHVTLLNTLATSSFLQEEDWRAFHAQATNALQGRSYVVLVDMAGRQIVNTYVPYGQEPQTTGDPDTLRRIAETGRPVFSNLFTSKVVRRPVLNVSVPVLRGERPAYVLSLGLLPEDIAGILTSLHLEPDWVATVWDANGTVIARSRYLDRFLGSLIPAELRGQGRPRTVFRATNLDGQRVLQAVATSGLSGWGAAVNVSAEKVDRQLLSAAAWLAGTVLLTALAGVALAWSMSRGLTRALADTETAALALGRNQSLRAPPSRVSELNEVNRALERAHDDLTRDRAALAETDAQKTMIIRELNHRMRNMLTLVQSIAELTMAAYAPREVTAGFYGRLKALALSSDLLTTESWDSADLGEIVDKAIAPHVGASLQFDLGGPAVRIPAKAAVALVLALHELCTNATKYGALSSPAGRVKIGWALYQEGGRGRVKLRWQEMLGPPVAAPAREGLGTALITQAVAHDISGSVELVHAPDGTVCTMDFPSAGEPPGASFQ